MKVLLVSNGFPPSGQWGTEFYTYQLATGLSSRGHEVSVLCPARQQSGPRFSLDRSDRSGIALLELHNDGDPRKPFADSYACEGVEAVFDRLLRELEPDVVHFTHLLWGLSLRLPGIARSRGIRTAATLTDYGLLCHRGQLLDFALRTCEGVTPARCARCIRRPGSHDLRPLGRAVRTLVGEGLALAQRASLGLDLVVTEEHLRAREFAVQRALASLDCVITPTAALAERMTSLGLELVHPEVLPYTLDEEPYLREPSSTSPGVTRFGFLGQFLPHKGLHVLFDAVRRLQRQPECAAEAWEVLAYGNAFGGRHRRYWQDIWRRDLLGRIRVEGPFEPLRAPEVLAGLDVAVLPSIWDENAPLGLLQARAAGVTIIASDVPGIREVAHPDAFERLVPPGDSRALAEAMRAAIFDRPSRQPGRRPLPSSFVDHMCRIEALYAGRRFTDQTTEAPAAELQTQIA